MARPAINAAARTETGKGFARRLRAGGRLPAVVYGRGAEPLPIAVDPQAVAGILNSDTGANTPIDLHVDGEAEPRLTLIKDYQVHPFKRTLKHVDFWQVMPDTMVVVETPLKRVGRASIEETGARIVFTHKSIKIRSRAVDVRPVIEFDVSSLPEGQWAITVSEVPLPEGLEAVFKSDYAVLQLRVPKVETTADEADAEVEEVEASEAD